MASRLSMQILEDILREGTEGDYDAFHSWCRMYLDLSKIVLPEKFLHYQNCFHHTFGANREAYDRDCQDLTPYKVSSLLEKKNQENTVKKDKINNREKFLLSDLQESHLKTSEVKRVVFLTNLLKHEPIYFFISKIKNWLGLHGADENEILETAIAMTEAIENAVKYSDMNPIIVEHSLIDRVYEFTMYNSVKEISDDASEEELLKGGSLMRGVLILSKILDDFTIDRDNSKNMVTLHGKIGLS